MKKTIISIVIIALTFAFGIWIGKTKFKNDANEDTENPEVIDTAMVNAEKRFDEKFPIYMVRGGMPQPEDHYRYFVDRWYGFRFRVKSNSCTDPENDNIDVKSNNKTDSILTKRIGKDWYKKFEKTVDSLYAIDTLAVHIAENDVAVQNLIKSKSKKFTHKFYPNYRCIATSENNLKVISVEWEGKIYNDSANVSFMRVAVDMKANKVKKIESSEIEWSRYP